ncbi:MarR family transcriptional regulator [Rhodobacterales bacterium HKCCE2091]|nr:MarR family transcriptional regulator [Rhodobacterales bacterium HKCCE2091]
MPDTSGTPRRDPAEDDGIGTEDSDIRALFSFTLQRLASLSTKIATRSVYEPYGLNIPEWRVLAVLGYLGEVSVLTVAKHAAVLRTQLPRVTSELEKRGLVRRKANPEDGRSALLSLTETGQTTVDEILRKSRDRNEAMLADLSPDERRELMRLVRQVIRTSRDYLDGDGASGGG